MNKTYSLLAALLASFVLMTACTSEDAGDTSSEEENAVVEIEATSNESTVNSEQKVSIVLGDSITIDGEGAKVNDEGVLINATGTYTISGTLKDGMIHVNAENVELVLNGVDITNSNGPAILFTNESEALVTLAEGTTNSLSDGGDSDYDGALYSTGSLTIQGDGSLDVVGNAEEGIAGEMHLNINGGTIHVTSKDDGLNANNDNISIITINDGYLYIAAGGDGIDSNGALTINGGTVITLSSLTDANGGLDADGEVLINGGTVIATGERLSTPTTNSSQQSVIVDFGSTQQAGTLVSIQQEEKQLLNFAPALAYRSLLFSSADLEEDISYQVYSGGSATGENADGVYGTGSYSEGTLKETVTTDSISSYKSRGRR